MELRDLIIGPIFFAFILMLALLVRVKFTDSLTKKYFLPALIIKMVGAVSLGLVYYGYYGGMGDTVLYYEHGVVHMYEAFFDSPLIYLKLLLADGGYDEAIWAYAQPMWYYSDDTSFFLIKIVSVFDIFTAHSYMGTALCMAGLSFTGVWSLFRAFYKLYPNLNKKMALAIFFMPSLFFWGSGLLKDTLTFCALGWSFYSIVNLVYFPKVSRVKMLVILLIGMYVIVSVKIYIAICFIPAVLFWVSLKSINKIESGLVRRLAFPFYLSLALVFGYLALLQIGSINSQYSIDKIAHTAETTAWWIGFVSESEGGAYYSLGDLDFTPTGMLLKSPRAVWVSLFRPHPWEVKTPIMLLSALESLFFLILTIRLFIKNGFQLVFRTIRKDPFLIGISTFSLLFAFAVGVTSQNFGTLARYKIPLMPFYLIMLFIVEHKIIEDKTAKILNFYAKLKE